MARRAAGLGWLATPTFHSRKEETYIKGFTRDANDVENLKAGKITQPGVPKTRQNNSNQLEKLDIVDLFDIFWERQKLHKFWSG